jgi:hypothetical protein
MLIVSVMVISVSSHYLLVNMKHVIDMFGIFQWFLDEQCVVSVLCIHGHKDLDHIRLYLHACIKCFLLNAMTFLANLTTNSTIRAGCVAWLNLTFACISPAAG